MKIKFNSDDELPLNKTIEIPSMVVVVRAISSEDNKFYPQFFLDECLYKLQMRARTRKLSCMAKKSFHILLTILLVTIALLIVIKIYCYLMKYKAKRKQLLPFYVADNKLKEILY